MINDRSIDLTAHNDFNQPSVNDLDNILESIHLNFDTFLAITDSEDINTTEPEIPTEKYRDIVKYNKFFGDHRHYNRAFEIFRDHSRGSELNLKGRCVRCGRRIMPWNRYETCPKCDAEMKEIVDGDRCPWNIRYEGSSDDDARDILSLR